MNKKQYILDERKKGIKDSEIARCLSISRQRVNQIAGNKTIKKNIIEVEDGFTYCYICKQIKKNNLFVKNKKKCLRCESDRVRYFRRGVTGEQYKDLLKKQNGKCYICNQKEKGSKSLSIDHNHKTGINRKLLCYRCNIVLGRVEENTEILQKMIMYIKEHL